MKTTWYIQQYPRDRDISTQNLIYAIKEIGYPIHVEPYIPFDFDHDLTFLPSDRPVVFHGAISCARSVQKRKLPMFPFAWFDFDLLCCHSYYAHWGKYLAQRVYGFFPMGDLLRRKDWLYNVYGREDRIFIRPDTNDKIFVGSVVAKDRFESFLNYSFVEEEMPRESLVVSSPEDICREWRLLVVDGKVITGTRYMDRKVLDTEPGYPQEVADFAEEVAKVWSPHPAYCIDIGLADFGFCVVECGSINCAGFYEMDLRKLVRALSDLAERQFSERSFNFEI